MVEFLGIPEIFHKKTSFLSIASHLFVEIFGFSDIFHLILFPTQIFCLFRICITLILRNNSGKYWKNQNFGELGKIYSYGGNFRDSRNFPQKNIILSIASHLFVEIFGFSDIFHLILFPTQIFRWFRICTTLILTNNSGKYWKNQNFLLESIVIARNCQVAT